MWPPIVGLHHAWLEAASVPGAEGGEDEEQVAEDGHHDGDHVERDPAPLVVLPD